MNDLTKVDAVPVSHCHDCGQPLRVFYQPGLLPERPGYDQAECVNRECELYKVTLTPQRLAALTEDERERYREMRRGAEARERLDMARCLLAARRYLDKHPLKQPLKEAS